MSPPDLPAVLVLTDRRAAADAGHDLTEIVAACAGLDVAVVVREKDLPRQERTVLTTGLADAARHAGVPVVVASSETLASMVAAQGLHLAAADPMPSVWDGWIGRSCHDEVELVGAVEAGMDYATVSPVYETASKPGYGPALGPGGLRALTEGCAVPVYALAGVTTARVKACVDAGAHGVAVQGAVMGALDPAVEVGRLVAAVLDARSRAACR